MLTLIGAKGTRTRRVIWMLEELGLAYEHDEARPHSATARHPWRGVRCPLHHAGAGSIN